MEAPDAFIQAITRIIQDKQNNPLVAQIISPDVNDNPPPSGRPASSSGGHGRPGAVTTPPCTATCAFPTNASGQRDGCHSPKTGTRAIGTHAVGVTGQYEVLMFGQYTRDPEKVVNIQITLLVYLGRPIFARLLFLTF